MALQTPDQVLQQIRNILNQQTNQGGTTSKGEQQFLGNPISIPAPGHKNKQGQTTINVLAQDLSQLGQLMTELRLSNIAHFYDFFGGAYNTLFPNAIQVNSIPPAPNTEIGLSVNLMQLGLDNKINNPLYYLYPGIMASQGFNFQTQTLNGQNVFVGANILVDKVSRPITAAENQYAISTDDFDSFEHNFNYSQTALNAQDGGIEIWDDFNLNYTIQTNWNWHYGKSLTCRIFNFTTDTITLNDWYADVLVQYSLQNIEAALEAAQKLNG